jgi:hypothetical protein
MAAGPDGRLRSIANVLEENSFACIRAQMTQDEVLHVLGPPDYNYSVYLGPRRTGVAVALLPIYGYSARFWLFDGTSGAVRSTMSLSDALGHRAAAVRCSR